MSLESCASASVYVIAAQFHTIRFIVNGKSGIGDQIY